MSRGRREKEVAYFPWCHLLLRVEQLQGDLLSLPGLEMRKSGRQILQLPCDHSLLSAEQLLLLPEEKLPLKECPAKE